MSMQQIMRWGHDFLRIRWGGYSNLWGQWGKPKCQWENPSNSQLPFLSHSPNHLILPEISWVGYCMEWAMYESPNSNWRSHQFLGNAFWLLGQAKTQKSRAFYHAFMLACFPHHFFLHVSSLRHPKLLVCVFIPRFWLLASFPMEGRSFL